MANQILLKNLKSTKMKVLWRILWVLVLIWEVSITSLVNGAEGDFYQGTVVDAETGEPLAEAVVTVLWFKKPYLSMDGPQYFHKGTEVMTDAAGRFSIDASPGTDWNPFTFLVKDPWIVIFKPGYGPLTPAYPRGLEHMFEELRKGVTVRLPKLRTREELMKFANLTSVGITSNTPNKQIPNLIKLLNDQRRSLSFEGYPQP